MMNEEAQSLGRESSPIQWSLSADVAAAAWQQPDPSLPSPSGFVPPRRPGPGLPWKFFVRIVSTRKKGKVDARSWRAGPDGEAIIIRDVAPKLGDTTASDDLWRT